MSIDEQIEAAWKEESPKVRESLQCSRASQVLGAAKIGFESGYRAALRSLYVEVKPEKIKFIETVWVMDGGKVFQADVFRQVAGGLSYEPYDGGETGSIRSHHKMIKLGPLPSPSEVFGEEGCEIMGDLCYRCDGTGERDFLSGARCYECGGTGWIEERDFDEDPADEEVWQLEDEFTEEGGTP